MTAELSCDAILSSFPVIRNFLNNKNEKLKKKSKQFTFSERETQSKAVAC